MSKASSVNIQIESVRYKFYMYNDSVYLSVLIWFKSDSLTSSGSYQSVIQLPYMSNPSGKLYGSPYKLYSDCPDFRFRYMWVYYNNGNLFMPNYIDESDPAFDIYM